MSIRVAATFLVPALLLVMGCEPAARRLPASVGGQGEVLVVMEQAHWDGPPGAALRALLEQPLARLPQREPRFKVAHTVPSAFGNLLSTHHNVVNAVIGAAADTTAVQRIVEPYAKGQLMVQVSAPEPQTWLELVRTRSDAMIVLIEEHQRERITSRLKSQQDAALVGSLRTAHALTLSVPAGYRVVEQQPEITWLQRDRLMSGSGLEHNVIEGILVYHYPYTSDSTFTMEYLVEMRDNVTSRHVRGPSEGSYMVVQRSFGDLDLMPDSRSVQVDGRFGYLIHGLYGMHGAKMGGPFVSLTTIDEERGRVVTVEGFVYAPQFDKREYLRELEAILFSLRLEPKEAS
jgi:hypothetical protein